MVASEDVVFGDASVYRVGVSSWAGMKEIERGREIYMRIK